MHNPQHDHYLEIFQHAPAGIGIIDLDGRWIQANSALCEMIGYTEEELLNTTFIAVTHPDDIYRDAVLMDRLLSGKQNGFDMEKRFIHKEGYVIWTSIQMVNSASRNGNPSKFIAYMQNITSRKASEPQLKESEQRYRLLAEHSTDIIIRYARDTTIIYVSPSCTYITGYEPKELIGQLGMQFVHQEDQEWLNLQDPDLDPNLTQCRETYRIRKKDGSYLWVESANKLVRDPATGQTIETISVIRDITGQRLQQEKLRQNEELFKLISENAHDVISQVSPEGICWYISPSIRNMLGYEPEEVIGKHSLAFTHPEDAAALQDTHILSLSDVDLLTLRIRHKDGTYRWMESVLKNIRDEQGNVEKILSISRDISERKLAEEELRMQEERYRELVEHSPDAVIISSRGRWLYVNDTAVHMLGGNNKEEVMEHSYRFIHPDCLESARLGLQRVEQGRASELMEQRFVRMDGHIIDVEVKSLPTVYQQEPAIYTIVRDISERKKTQELLKASEKLNIAGQLAAGIAHEIRNPLTSLKGFLKFIQSGASYKQEYFDIMRDEMDRIELIVSELLVLAKPGTGAAFRDIDLNNLLKVVITLLETQANLNNTQLIVEYSKEPLTVTGDENQLKQVFINLIKNAIEAMNLGGIIRIESQLKEPKALVRIVDHGSGIPEEAIPRIGEPFYTTKEKGTGLGLMVSFKIIEHHGGDIRIRSKAGKGTTFEISLPSRQ